MLDKFVTNYGHLPLIGLVLLVVIWVLAAWADRAVRKAFSRRDLCDQATTRLIGLGAEPPETDVLFRANLPFAFDGLRAGPSSTTVTTIPAPT